MPGPVPKPSRAALLRLARDLGLNPPEEEFRKLLDRAKQADDPEQFIRQAAQAADQSPTAAERLSHNENPPPTPAPIETPNPPMADAAEQAGSPLRSLPSRVAAEHAALLDELEQIVLAAVSRTPTEVVNQHITSPLRLFTPQESAIFARLNMAPREIAREWTRVSRLANFRAIAGTSAERQAAADLAVRSRRDLAERGPPLREQIAQLQRELEELEQTAAAAEADVQRRDKAVADALATLDLNHDSSWCLIQHRRASWPLEGAEAYIARFFG